MRGTKDVYRRRVGSTHPAYLLQEPVTKVSIGLGGRFEGSRVLDFALCRRMLSGEFFGDRGCSLLAGDGPAEDDC